MARTVQDVRLDTRSARSRLKVQKKPYFRLIEAGRHIGYYRGTRGGTWLARLNREGRYVEAKLGAADDVRDANGIDVLTFTQAQGKARDWFDQQARLEHGTPAGPYTVAQACDDYLADYLRRSGKDASTEGRLSRIKAALGKVEVAKLKAKQIKDWHSSLAESSPLTRSQAVDEATGRRRVREIDSNDPDVRRRRKASANRQLNVLKAVLNHAFHHPPEGVVIPSRAAWEAVKPYREADAPKVRYLTDAEAIRLLNACDQDFRELVTAALLTGCRYGELRRLKVRDFDEVAASLRIETSKAGRPRSVALSEEGVAHFHRLAVGRAGDDLLLVRADGGAWQASQQLRRMEQASDRAKISPRVSFHILRHTYGSRLAMAGAPMAVIAAQLGHSGTRMTERHYAHLGPSYVADTFRAFFGDLGLAKPENEVVAMANRPRRATL
jgi:integrase